MHGDFDITEPGQEVAIDGPHRGDIRCRLLVVGREASVFGNVIADEVRVAGRFDGTCHAKTFLASSTARVYGAVNAGVLGIKPGARVRAHFGPEFPEAFAGALSPSAEAALIREIERSLTEGGLAVQPGGFKEQTPHVDAGGSEAFSVPSGRTTVSTPVRETAAVRQAEPKVRRQLPPLV